MEDRSKNGEAREIIKKISNDEDREKVKEYYEEAWKFTKWFNEKIDDINTIDNEANRLKIDDKNSAMPEDSSSFNDVKYDVIKDSITKNLRQAMQIYGNRMPKFTGEDWELILNNVCFIAFMQGMPVGTTMYNDYTIAVSTENKETVRGIDLYFVGEDGDADADGRYHRIWCPHLKGEKIKGYYKTEFKMQKISSKKDTLACYYCVVRASHATWEYAEEAFKKSLSPIYNASDISKMKSAYFSSLIKEKLKLTILKQTGFVSASRPIKKEQVKIDWEKETFSW